MLLISLIYVPSESFVPTLRENEPEWFHSFIDTLWVVEWWSIVTLIRIYICGDCDSRVLQMTEFWSWSYLNVVLSRSFNSNLLKVNPIPSYDVYLNQPGEKMDTYEFFSTQAKTISLYLEDFMDIRLSVEKYKFLRSSTHKCIEDEKESAQISDVRTYWKLNSIFHLLLQYLLPLLQTWCNIYLKCQLECFENELFNETCRMPGSRKEQHSKPCNSADDLYTAFRTNELQTSTNDVSYAPKKRVTPSARSMKLTFAPDWEGAAAAYRSCRDKCSKPCTQVLP